MGVIGRSKSDLDTPVLLVDLAVMERNIATIAKRIRAHGVSWRPHTKGQKVPAIAHKLLAAGAIGVTCAKLGEAEVMAAAGIRDILVSGPVVGPEKVTRLVNLLPHADVVVALDCPEHVAALSAAASAKGYPLRVVVEVDVGMGRCGVPPGEPVVDLARTVARSPGLRFAGVMGWEGQCVQLRDPQEKRACVERAIRSLTDSADRCRAAGLPVEIVSCGGTGTYWVTATLPGVTEIQAGGGIFNDVRYADLYGLDEEHGFALTVLATVISRPTPNRVVLDAGFKTMSSEHGAPRPLDVPGVEVVRLSAEHTRLELREPNHRLRVGDRVEFIVGYSDSTVFLHDELYGVRDGRVEVVWPIVGRGKIR
jgi:D-serine deaminase-like pyridoxal phosphate-dependent protein